MWGRPWLIVLLALPVLAQPALPPGTPNGYLAAADLPDSLGLLPPPPAASKAAFVRDEEVRIAAGPLRNSPRFVQATSDADQHFPHAARTLSCALNVPISREATPHLYALLGRSSIDLGLPTYRAKDRYRRTRPFAMHREATCTPGDERFLNTDGSYPSGHSAAGWGWALLLTEIASDRADAILRDWTFGQSRIACNVHWQSDVDAGRVIAAATVARLHADPAFRADLEAAQWEIAAERASGTTPSENCRAEAAALAG